MQYILLVASDIALFIARVFYGMLFIKTGLPKIKNLQKNGKNFDSIGFHPGAGSIFAHKSWNIDGYANLAEMLEHRLKAKVLVFGSEKEKKDIERLKEICKVSLIETGYNNNLRQFAALLKKRDIFRMSQKYLRRG